MSAHTHDSKSETDGGDSFGRRRHRPHHDTPMEVSMATQTLSQRDADASVAAPVPIGVLAGGRPTPPVTLDLGGKTGSAPASNPPALNEDQANVAATEEWRSIPNWPEYEVSEFGHVRRRLRGGSPIAKVGRRLRPSPGLYAHVYLHGTAGRRHISIHRLVALAFLGEPPSRAHQVAHNDGNPRNNHYANLRYATPRENNADKIRHGTAARGEKAGPSKFTATMVRQVRLLAAKEVPQEIIAEIFETSQSHIGRIVRKELWGHVE